VIYNNFKLVKKCHKYPGSTFEMPVESEEKLDEILG